VVTGQGDSAFASTLTLPLPCLYVGIDLAPRHSATVITNDRGRVLYETSLDLGPQPKVPDTFSTSLRILEWWTEILLEVGKHQGSSPLFAVESAYFHAFQGGPAIRLQGCLLGFMAADGFDAHQPTAATWQRAWGFSPKLHSGHSKQWAQELCESLSYDAGLELGTRTKVKARTRSDLRDAFLLSQWLRGQVTCTELPDLKFSV
jgi:hypothetical protein